MMRLDLTAAMKPTSEFIEAVPITLVGMVEVSDFVPFAQVEPEIIAEYGPRVPGELVELWEQYGYGTFAEGFLRVINPKTYEAEVGDCIGKTQGDGIAIPIMVTGLGDLITWEPSVGVIGILHREDRTVGLGGKMATFLGLLRMTGASYLSRSLNWDIFPEAVEAHGELPYEESFTFVPLLSLGGQTKVENLHKRETTTAIQMMVEFQGVIGH